VQVLLGELVVTTPGLLPEGVAAIGDHVGAIQQRNQHVEVVVDDLAVRHPHQHDRRPVQTTGNVPDLGDSGQAAVVAGLASTLVGIPADDLMSLLDGELAQTQAHPAQADDRELHDGRSSRGWHPLQGGTLLRARFAVVPAGARLGQLEMPSRSITVPRRLVRRRVRPQRSAPDAQERP
jgi:hypothetical protein